MLGSSLGCKVTLFLCLSHLVFPSAVFWLLLLEAVCEQGQGFGTRAML